MERLVQIVAALLVRAHCLPAGTVSAVDTPSNSVTVGAAYNPANPAAQPATMTLNANFGSGAQPISYEFPSFSGDGLLNSPVVRVNASRSVVR